MTNLKSEQIENLNFKFYKVIYSAYYVAQKLMAHRGTFDEKLESQGK